MADDMGEFDLGLRVSDLTPAEVKVAEAKASAAAQAAAVAGCKDASHLAGALVCTVPKT